MPIRQTTHVDVSGAQGQSDLRQDQCALLALIHTSTIHARNSTLNHASAFEMECLINL